MRAYMNEIETKIAALVVVIDGLHDRQWYPNSEGKGGRGDRAYRLVLD